MIMTLSEHLCMWELQLFSYSVIEFGNVESSAYVLCPRLEYLLSTASVHYFSPLRALSMQWLCRYPRALEDKRYLMSLYSHSKMSFERENWDFYLECVHLWPSDVLPIAKIPAWLVIPSSTQFQGWGVHQLLNTTNALLHPTLVDDSVLECVYTVVALMRVKVN